jgi:hypothetical protein
MLTPKGEALRDGRVEKTNSRAPGVGCPTFRIPRLTACTEAGEATAEYRRPLAESGERRRPTPSPMRSSPTTRASTPSALGQRRLW